MSPSVNEMLFVAVACWGCLIDNAVVAGIVDSDDNDVDATEIAVVIMLL